MSRVILAAVVLAILGVSGAVAYQEALDGTGTTATVQNESWQPSAGDVTQLDESNVSTRFYFETSNISVRDENETTMTAGDDYEWYPRNGTIKALSGGDLAGDSEAFIDYGYTEVGEEEKETAELLGYVPMVVGGLVVLGIVVIFGRVIS